MSAPDVARCSDCTEPATEDMHAGFVLVGQVYVAMTRPLCRTCAVEDAYERAEKRAS